MLAEARASLDGVRDLEQRSLAERSRNELQADGQARTAESARHGDGGKHVALMRELERIHSMYEPIGRPSISAAYSSSTGNGSTCVTGHAR